MRAVTGAHRKRQERGSPKRNSRRRNCICRLKLSQPFPLGNPFFYSSVERLSTWKRIGAFGVATAIGFSSFLLQFNYAFLNDWFSYIGSHALVGSSCVKNYGVFPIHNPYVCGGKDLLSNPQGRIVTPVGLVEMVFPPQWANLITMILYSVVGLFCMYRLLRHLGVSESVSTLGAIIYTQGTWFGLHFAEGHGSYAMMQLLPLAYYFGLRIKERKIQFACGALFTLFLLEGAIQAFVFYRLLISKPD